MRLWCPIMERKEIIMSISVCPDLWLNINSKSGRKKVFLTKAKHQFIYPNKENAFMVPNHEKKEDYYMNLCLPYLMTNFYSKK